MINNLYKIFFLLFLIVISINIFAGVIVIDGQYQERNVYVQNGYSFTGVGFCTYEINVNGKIATDEINNSSFEIDLSVYGFKIGESVEIQIKFKDDGCFPKVLNINALIPNPSFETTSINIDNKGTLHWSTINEKSKLNFIIEQFKWNKWIPIGEIEGNGGSILNNYSFQTIPIAGNNKYRVKQKGFIDKTKFSPTVSYTSLKKEIVYIYNRKKKLIEFSEGTSYEMYDKFGNLIKKGHSESVSISNLNKDNYYVSYGNTISEFKKK